MLLQNLQAAQQRLILPMILPLCLWLVSLSFTSQEQLASNCISSSGNLSAPELFMDKSSASVGDKVLFRCLTPREVPVSFAFLCTDGKGITRKPAILERLSFDFLYHVSGQSSGNFSCGYQHKRHHKQVQNSHLSIARYLSVTDKTTNSSSYDSEKTSSYAPCQCKSQRKQNAEESTDKAAAAKFIGASSAEGSHYTGPQGRDKTTEQYESLNPRAVETTPYSTLHLEQKSKPAVSASQLTASSHRRLQEKEPADKEVEGDGYERLNSSSVQKGLYSTLHHTQ
ncbi:uncharacterized protein LOC142025227 isoform X2 [Carettochelys insculpta]|uniref:uncharacterized protein LOC142025227 isoform X2 n=1 Tax=Carettochelys insculpta TaxID=44489 RepID=UPI003EBF9B37